MVLFLVSAVERNIYDQRCLEYHIYENHSEIKVIRRTLHQIRTGGFLSPNKELIVSVFFVCVILFCFFKPPPVFSGRPSVPLSVRACVRPSVHPSVIHVVVLCIRDISSIC